MDKAKKNTLWKAGKGMSLIGFLWFVMWYFDMSFGEVVTYNITGTYLALAGICIAIYETLAHHFDRSTFKGLNPKWWNALDSWVNKYRYQIKLFGIKIQYVPVVFTDGWHFFKGLSTVFILLACINYSFEYSLKEFIILYCYYKIPFTVFYSYYLIKK